MEPYDVYYKELSEVTLKLLHRIPVPNKVPKWLGYVYSDYLNFEKIYTIIPLNVVLRLAHLIWTFVRWPLFFYQPIEQDVYAYKRYLYALERIQELEEIVAKQDQLISDRSQTLLIKGPCEEI